MGHHARMKKIAAGIGVVTALTALTITPALAADVDQTEVTAAIAEGTRNVSLSEFSLSGGTYDFDGNTLTASDITLTAEDQTGTFAGWQVTMNASDFTGANGSISANGFTVSTLDEITEQYGTSAGLPIAGASGSLAGAGQIVLTAAEDTGNGQYTAKFDLSLEVPATVKAGTYTSTLTTTIGIAPEV